MNEDDSRRAMRTRLLRGYGRLGIRILGLSVILLVLFTQVYPLHRVRGTEMFPAVKDGDLLLAFRFQHNYRKNDIVLYLFDGERRVGRIVAVESDYVNILEDGTLIVNGTQQRGEVLFRTDPRGGEYPIQVPGGYVFLLGDNREEARDSRDFGSVPLRAVEGKVISLFRRRGF